MSRLKFLRSRVVATFALLGICAISSNAQRGFQRSLFQRYPFDQWASENTKPQLRWNARIEPPRLSVYQRLVSQVHIAVDGSELATRQNGQFVALVRIEDSAGHRYQIDNQTYISQLKKGDRFDRLNFSFSVFVTPGDYTVSLAVCDAKTLQHSFTRQTLHVNALKSDPLPDSWEDLPPVEFVPDGGPPYSWYLPQLSTRVLVPIDNEHPVRIDLLVNTTPTDLGSAGMFRLNMQNVVPALKVLMGIKPAQGSVGVTIADLNRRVLTYEQPELRLPDPGRSDLGRGGGRGEWNKLRPVFTEFSAAKVDVKTLAGQRKMLDYFSGQVTRLLGGEGQTGGGDGPTVGIPHVLIVLSAPAYFTKQERPPLPDLPPDTGRRVFYIRYAQFLPRTMEGQSYSFADDLEHLLKPMGARTFRVENPEGFRKALGTVRAEIAKY